MTKRTKTPARSSPRRPARPSLLEPLEERLLLSTYYVDFDGGLDTASGTSVDTPWKHYPGDSNATGLPKTTTLHGGDTVIFKGGVHYRGTVTAAWSGSSGSLIVYDGNTAGTFGTGRAILDGSQFLTNWTAVASADEVGGNANWQHIYETTLPSGFNIFSLNLYEDDSLLTLAQGPNVADPLFFDDTATFRSVPPANVTTSTLIDASFFTQSDASYWNSSYIRIWAGPNLVYTQKVTAYSPSEHKITFDTVTAGVYTDRNTLYAMTNQFSLIDIPGEYVVNETTGTVYLWPMTEADPNQSEVTVSVRTVGFNFNAKSHVTIQGFLVEKNSGAIGGWNNGVGIRNTGVAADQNVLNNEVTRNWSMEKYGAIYLFQVNGGLIQGNYVHDNTLCRGIHVAGSSGNGSSIVTDHNTLDHNGGTGIYYAAVTGGAIEFNTVTRHMGTHANGITVYQGSTDILVLGNTVSGGHIALTTQASQRVTIAYNVLLTTGMDDYTIADWGTCSDLHYYNNVAVNDYKKGLTISSSSLTGLVIRNNILDGCLMNTPGSNVTNNIYTALAWNQDSRYGWYLGAGEMTITNKSTLFVDPAGRDYRPKAGSAAIDAGADVGLTVDHNGTTVPTPGGVDIGAYETLLGDFDVNWRINDLDIDALTAALRAGSTAARYDIDRSGAVNHADVDYLVRTILATQYGDANLDGRVDVADQVAANLGLREAAQGWTNGDFTGDGSVTASDLAVLKQYWHWRHTAGAQPAASPPVSSRPSAVVSPATDAQSPSPFSGLLLSASAAPAESNECLAPPPSAVTPAQEPAAFVPAGGSATPVPGAASLRAPTLPPLPRTVEGHGRHVPAASPISVLSSDLLDCGLLPALMPLVSR